MNVEKNIVVIWLQALGTENGGNGGEAIGVIPTVSYGR